MAKEPPRTVGDLRRMAIVSDGEIMAVVDAFLDDPQVNAFRFTRGRSLDVAAAVAGHMTAVTVLADPKPKPRPV